ncbi:MAG: type II toxin-antitoxin system VapC family toxin [Micrococcales bacterium]|nr:type II toxin-antitoxin system VapC family toxin [Micrococcales bacterium]MCL2667497.1 type II toxin-antitoxin system VapC family toxin [Micrococcales bacterium]
MDYLLDTHIVLWFAQGSHQLPSVALEAIVDPQATCGVSVASAWEVAIKVSLGKLELDGGANGFFEILDHNGFALLPIGRAEVMKVQTLPFHHRDPFDRLLIATAMVRNLTLISVDTAFSAYGTSTLP